MAELITALIDIGLGLLAYRLASENRKAIEAVKEDVELLKLTLRKAGLLDLDAN